MMLHNFLSFGLYADVSRIDENCGHPDNEELLRRECDSYSICYYRGRNDLAS